MMNTEALVKNYLRHAQVDYVGLWQIAAHVADIVGLDNPAEIRRGALDVVEGIMARGLMPGDYTKEGFVFWSGSDEALLRRVADEWDALPDGMPNLGDSSCWFSFRPR